MKFFLPSFLVANLFFLSSINAQDAKTEIFESKKESLVTLVMTHELNEKEIRSESNATVLDSSGIFATSNNAVERGATNSIIQAAQAGQAKVKPELVSISLLHDGDELDAEVLLKDPDKNIAIIRLLPEEKANAPKFVAVGEPADKPQILNEVITLRKLPEGLNREAIPVLSEITALIPAPQNLYIPSTIGLSGAPFFDMDGKFLGVGSTSQQNAVIVPAATINRLLTTATKK